MSHDKPLPRALCFDVFGTVVDWRGSIAREAREIAARFGVTINGARFADHWRAGYVPAMQRVRSGELSWKTIDELHRLILEDLIIEFKLDALDDAARLELNEAWHRLSPWRDSVAGVRRLRRRFLVTTLSNGNIRLLADLSRHAGITWDALFSAELFGHYKPDPDTYLGAARLLGLEPREVMLVAAHKSDLRAAAACGLSTALIDRPLEYGRGRHPDPAPDAAFDFNARDINDLAAQLGA